MNRSDVTPPALDQHDTLYTAGSRLMWPHLRFANRLNTVLSFEAKTNVKDGIAHLRAAIEVRPGDRKNWSTFWLLGKAYEALGDFENSYGSFKTASEINPEHVDVVRELVASCLKTARTAEAVGAAKAARNLAPSDPGIVANLALALFTNGQLAEALSAGRQAIKLGPSDAITHSLIDRIERTIGRERRAGSTHCDNA